MGVVVAIGGVLVLTIHGVDRPDGAGTGEAAPSASASADEGEVVSIAGIGDIRFGETSADLTRRHGLHNVASACMARFTSPENVNPIFVDGKLAILSLEAPVHTPEGVMVGTPVDTVRVSYPDATQLSPPEQYAFAGLLAARGDLGYLFLYSSDTVEKILVGYSVYLRQLFAAGFPTC